MNLLTTLLASALVLLPLLGALADTRAVTGRAAGTGDPLTLWYPAPAKVWEEALPVGNGRLGAMVFGGVDHERLQLNDITVWSGGPELTADRPDAYTHLPELRAAIRAGDHQKADQLAQQYMTCQAGYEASYQTLGDLTFDFALPAGAVTDYSRSLDIGRAVSAVEYTLNGARYKREVISSAPAGVIAVHLTCSRPNAIHFTLDLSRIESAQTTTHGSDTLVMTGNTNMGAAPGNLDYEAQAKVTAPGGTVTASGTQITVAGANEATVLLAAGTTYVLDYAKHYRGPDPRPAVVKTLASASALTYGALKAQHVTDYQSFFDRVHLSLGHSDSSRLRLPTEVRLGQYGDGRADPALAMLFYQFGRYLLISSSRPGNPLPSNSQGLWGDGLDLPWKCDYKSNINFEMNYWPVETANLSACHLPMLRLVESLVAPGRKTAKAYYYAPGWFYAYTTNAWGWTSPGGGLPWGVWTGASGWACRHLWEHYAFTRDKSYLKQVYPVMKEAAEFYLSVLVPDADGCLVTSPSTSPENQFRDDAGKTGLVTEGTAIDREIIWDLFTNVIQATETLQEDADFRAKMQAALAKMRPLQIGKAGQLEEWPKDWDENAPEPHHRHVSHLFALHPGRQISALTTPALAAAARETLKERGDEGTGWSKAWKINCWARLHDGDHAFQLVSEQLELVTTTRTHYDSGGGTYANLFDAHPPFQIDGNFGALSGITEMLLQSQDRYVDPARPEEDHYLIELLPALPSAWPAGSVTGLRARGGFEIDESWASGKLSHATLRSVGGTSCRVWYGGKVVSLSLKPGESVRLDGALNQG